MRLRPVRDECADRSAPRVELAPLERLLADVCARRYRLRPTACGPSLADGDTRSTDSGAGAGAAHSDEEPVLRQKRYSGSCTDLLSFSVEPKCVSSAATSNNIRISIYSSVHLSQTQVCSLHMTCRTKVMREILNKRHTLQPATARILPDRPTRPASLRDQLLHDIRTVKPRTQLKHVPQHERGSPRRTRAYFILLSISVPLQSCFDLESRCISFALCARLMLHILHIAIIHTVHRTNSYECYVLYSVLIVLSILLSLIILCTLLTHNKRFMCSL